MMGGHISSQHVFIDNMKSPMISLISGSRALLLGCLSSAPVYIDAVLPLPHLWLRGGGVIVLPRSGLSMYFGHLKYV